ncbi:M28 family peptidase [Winogradskyella thalassocola]|uniref:Por secretion system C-terminal sorting domain-containing protein n=1 Tax=Winogradskyella thalassocola TaxID=262004 RepID=A0A1G7Y730_9FLAO|nr:M28 family peptidase [Winogradskyella thalassocola]SDG92262.1 Por secretion system C-terminal sorting domain-containing protein [Winogradskyella thalassocola]
MKNSTIFTLLCALLCFNVSFSQSIQDIINTVSNSNLQLSVNELSGEQATMINGVSQTITSRVQNNNDLVADYIEERLSAMPNLNVVFQNFNIAGKNIIATQLGKTNPEDIYIVCAHYDSVAEYCADDNATGVAAVLEVARILSQQCTDNTIVYALWDEEEIGLLGANYYAQQAADDTNGNTRDNILGVINMDMIGFDGDAPGTEGDNDFDIDVRDIANSIGIKDDLLSILNTYTFDLDVTVVNPGTPDSDHSRFWNQGYSAVLVGESWSTDDESINYHSADDRVGDIDFQYMTEMTKLVAAYMATKSGLLALDNTVTQTGTSLIANQTAASYQWFNCDTETEISGAINQLFSPTTNGNYAVEVSSGSCMEVSNCITFGTLTSEEFTDEEILFYPNPVTSILKIENLKATELTIIVNDISGKRVYTNTFQNENFEIDLNNSPSGVYFVNVISKTKSSIFKIVKE